MRHIFRTRDAWQIAHLMQARILFNLWGVPREHMSFAINRFDWHWLELDVWEAAFAVTLQEDFGVDVGFSVEAFQEEERIRFN